MKNENWDDLKLFLHVAREGGLTGASEKTGASPATMDGGYWLWSARWGATFSYGGKPVIR